MVVANSEPQPTSLYLDKNTQSAFLWDGLHFTYKHIYTELYTDWHTTAAPRSTDVELLLETRYSLMFQFAIHQRMWQYVPNLPEWLRDFSAYRLLTSCGSTVYSFESWLDCLSVCMNIQHPLWAMEGTVPSNFFGSTGLRVALLHDSSCCKTRDTANKNVGDVVWVANKITCLSTMPDTNRFVSYGATVKKGRPLSVVKVCKPCGKARARAK